MKKTIAILVFLVASFITNAQLVHSFEDAQKLALGANKLIVIDFTASWCGPCKKMEMDVWNKEEVKAITANFVFAKIDLDTNKSLASMYGVKAIPNILIVDGIGNVLEQNTGYMNLSQVQRFLKPYQLNTEFMMNELLAYYKDKSYTSALRLALKNYDYTVFLDDANLKRSFVSLANEYLSDASKLVDKKSEKYDENKELIELVELSEYAYLFNFEKLNKKLDKIDTANLSSSYGKKLVWFYEYLLALSNNQQETFLENQEGKASTMLKAKAELIYKKSQG